VTKCRRRRDDKAGRGARLRVAQSVRGARWMIAALQ
jgi:hypothetical protein